MDPIVRRYSPEVFDGCLGLFKGNQTPYFAEQEFTLFMQFLTSEAWRHPFFVVPQRDAVVACGGFYVDGPAVGMVPAQRQAMIRTRPSPVPLG